MRRIEAAGGNIVGGRLVSGLQLDALTGDVSAVVSRDRTGNETVHPADGVVFAIGIGGVHVFIPPSAWLVLQEPSIRSSNRI